MKKSGLIPSNGQSTTEFTLLALVLTPLFIALPLIGKYLDLAWTTEIAARYLAFEATVYPAGEFGDDDALRAELGQRFFGAGGTAPHSRGRRAENLPNPLWKDARARALVRDMSSDIDLNTAQGPVNSPPGSAFMHAAGGREHRVEVSVHLRNLVGLPPFDEPGLTIRRHQLIHSGDGAASGPHEVASRIENGDFQRYPIQTLKALAGTVGRLPALVLDPTPDVGRVQPEIVPCDRLEGGC